MSWSLELVQLIPSMLRTTSNAGNSGGARKPCNNLLYANRSGWILFPLLDSSNQPEINLQGALKPISADDYQMTLEIPRFDDQWEQITLARSLIYCPLDFEHHG